MFEVQGDLGASLYKTWSEEQRRIEIEKLVAGIRSGLPLGIACNMVEKIAGGEKPARKHLKKLIPAAERKALLEKESGAMKVFVSRFLGDSK